MGLRENIARVRARLDQAARTAERFMFSVRTLKFRMLWSSMTRVLEVFAPVMPSLKAPVILELILRTFRVQWRMRG